MANGWEVFTSDDISIPRYCRKCNSLMSFKGVGEYQCEQCGYLDYDDYGKVRNYIEQNPGASTVEVEKATGVDQRTIRKMLRDGRFMITEDSKMVLYCDLCKKPIRYGKLCENCEKTLRLKKEELHKQLHQKPGIAGYGMSFGGEKGQKRYIHGE